MAPGAELPLLKRYKMKLLVSFNKFIFYSMLWYCTEGYCTDVDENSLSLGMKGCELASSRPLITECGAIFTRISAVTLLLYSYQYFESFSNNRFFYYLNSEPAQV